MSQRIFQWTQVKSPQIIGGFTFNGQNKILSGPSVVVKGYPWIPGVPVDEHDNYDRNAAKSFQPNIICNDDLKTNGKSAYNPCTTFNFNDIKNLTDQGENIIRLGVSWQGSHPVEGNINSEFQKRLTNFLEMVDHWNELYEEKPLGVIIDFHQDFGGYQCGYGIPLWFMKKCNPDKFGKVGPESWSLLTTIMAVLNKLKTAPLVGSKAQNLINTLNGLDIKRRLPKTDDCKNSNSSGWTSQPEINGPPDWVSIKSKPDRMWAGKNSQKTIDDMITYNDYYLSNKCCQQMNSGNPAEQLLTDFNVNTMNGMMNDYKADFIKFWTDIASTIKNNKCVFMLEIINEPPQIFRSDLFNIQKEISDALKNIWEQSDYGKAGQPAIGIADISTGIILPGWLNTLVDIFGTVGSVAITAILSLLGPIGTTAGLAISKLVDSYQIPDSVLEWGRKAENKVVFCWHWYGVHGLAEWYNVPDTLRGFQYKQFGNGDTGIPSFMTEGYSCEALLPLRHLGYNVSWWHYAAYCNTRGEWNTSPGAAYEKNPKGTKFFGGCVTGYGSAHSSYFVDPTHTQLKGLSAKCGPTSSANWYKKNMLCGQNICYFDEDPLPSNSLLSDSCDHEKLISCSDLNRSTNEQLPQYTGCPDLKSPQCYVNSDHYLKNDGSKCAPWTDWGEIRNPTKHNGRFRVCKPGSTSIQHDDMIEKDENRNKLTPWLWVIMIIIIIILLSLCVFLALHYT